MTATRRFLLDLAEGLDAAPRVNQIAPNQAPVIVMTDGNARMLADRARVLAGTPLPPVLSMPDKRDVLIRAEFRTKAA